jgi:hypothetical protein
MSLMILEVVVSHVLKNTSLLEKSHVVDSNDNIMFGHSPVVAVCMSHWLDSYMKGWRGSIDESPSGYHVGVDVDVVDGWGFLLT